MKTIVEVTEVSVEAPLVAGARASTSAVGFFSTYEKAETFVRKRIAEEVDEPEDDAGLRYYVLDGKVLDVARLDDHADTTILGRDGAVRGVIRGEYEEPWGGRDAETCRFKLGQLVGFVDRDVYKLGVVNGLPISTEEATRFRDVSGLQGLALGGPRPVSSRRRGAEPGGCLPDGLLDGCVRTTTPARVLLDGLLADEHEDREPKSLLDLTEDDDELGLRKDGLAGHDHERRHVATGVMTKLNIYLMSPQDCPGVEPSEFA